MCLLHGSKYWDGHRDRVVVRPGFGRRYGYGNEMGVVVVVDDMGKDERGRDVGRRGRDVGETWWTTWGGTEGNERDRNAGEMLRGCSFLPLIKGEISPGR